MTHNKENSLTKPQDIDDFTSLKGQFLLAMPSVDAGVFRGSVVYVVDHSPDGAAGVIINRATDVELSELVERFELESTTDLAEQWVFFWRTGAANACVYIAPSICFRWRRGA